MRDIDDIKIIKLVDGLVIYQTAVLAAQIERLRYFNNSFILLSHREFEKKQHIPFLMKKMIRNIDWSKVNTEAAHSYRLMASSANQLVHIDKTILQETVTEISGITNWKFSPDKANREIWFLFRDEGMALCGFRFTGLHTIEKYEKGELHRPLAHILCLIAEPSAEDLIIDPFAGSGAIAQECAYSFQYKQFVVTDTDSKLVLSMKQKLSKLPGVIVLKDDALHLHTRADNSVDRIITDPPWGIHDGTKQDLHSFYTKMINSFLRVLKVGGRAVILMGQKDIFDNVLSSYIETIEVTKTLDILVSGKKARIYVLEKK